LKGFATGMGWNIRTLPRGRIQLYVKQIRHQGILTEALGGVPLACDLNGNYYLIRGKLGKYYSNFDLIKYLF